MVNSANETVKKTFKKKKKIEMDIVSCELHVLLQVVINEMNHRKGNFER